MVTHAVRGPALADRRRVWLATVRRLGEALAALNWAMVDWIGTVRGKRNPYHFGGDR